MNDEHANDAAPGNSLDRLVGFVADGVQVDWEAEQQAASGEASLRHDLLIALRAIEGVASAARSGTASWSGEVGDALPLSHWGDLVIQRSLGHGSFGHVYLARDPMLDRLVALKLYPPFHADPARTEVILREGRLLARLRHPNIATVYGVNRHADRFGMWLEFVDGETLATAARERGCLAPHEVAVIGIELCHALAEVHRAGILHRDIKAQNVIRETGGRLVLVDFGLGLEERRAELTGPSGTPLYLAPELFRGGRPSVASDLYALGVLLFFLATARYPVEGGTIDELRAAHKEERRRLLRDLRPDVTTRLAAVVERALAREPGARFRSAGELEAALAGVLSQAAARPRRPLRTRVALGAGVTIATAVTVIVAVLGVRAVNEQQAAALFHGASSRRLTSTPDWETEPALSPDGSFIAYASNRSGDFDLWLMDTAGGEPVQLTSGPAEDRRPCWFPDGSRIAFESIRDGEPSVWAIGRLGGTPEFVLDAAGDPAVSPDEHSLAVSRVDAAGVRRIAVVDFHDVEAGPRTITGSGSGFWDHRRPAWSPDGRTICYQDLGNLWLVDVEGDSARRLTNDGAGYLAPVWGSSAAAVYVASNREGTLAIWRVPTNGSDPERLTLGTGPETEPSLSAACDRLAYATVNESLDVVVASLRTGATHLVRSDADDITPTIAPDGSFVVFSSDRRPG